MSEVLIVMAQKLLLRHDTDSTDTDGLGAPLSSFGKFKVSSI